MKKQLAWLVIVQFFCLAGLAASQSIVGRAIVDGDVVVLFDNGTWTLETPDPQSLTECQIIVPNVQFCGQSLGWKISPPGAPDITAAYTIDSRHFAQYIIEDIGTNDGVNPEFMRRMVLEIATDFAASEAEVMDISPVQIGDLKGETIIYRVNVNGVAIVMANSLFIEPQLTVQVMTYAIDTEYTPKHTELHVAFLANTQISE